MEKNRIHSVQMGENTRKSYSRIKEVLDAYNLHYSAVLDEKLISVTNVEAIKGLEFEYVVAVVNGMSINEEYIAYTRALDKLVVVKESF